MTLTDEELAAAIKQQREVMTVCLKAIADLPLPAGLDPRIVVLSTVDGLMSALGDVAEHSDMFRSEKERRKFADECRTGILKCMKASRDEVVGVANDTTH